MNDRRKGGAVVAIVVLLVTVGALLILWPRNQAPFVHTGTFNSITSDRICIRSEVTDVEATCFPLREPLSSPPAVGACVRIEVPTEANASSVLRVTRC